ncbi:MAG: hypothetical protein ABL973_18575 [Micropepsaceae bacterium]
MKDLAIARLALAGSVGLLATCSAHADSTEVSVKGSLSKSTGQFRSAPLDTATRPVAGTEVQRLLDIIVSPGSSQGAYSMSMSDDQNNTVLTVTSDGASLKTIRLASVKSNRVIGAWTVTGRTSPAEMAQISQSIANEMILSDPSAGGARGIALAGQRAR